MSYLDELLSEEEVPKPVQAARLVAEALAKDSGRRKKHNYWVSVTRPVFGDVRITSKLWDKVLEAGEEEGLFRVDDKTLDYPILVLTKGKTLVEVFEEESEAPAPPKKKSVPEPEPEPDPEPLVKNPNPMEFLECGHWNWQEVPKTREECDARELARLEANQEHRSGTVPSKTVRFTSAADCWKCSKKKGPDSYQDQKPGFQTAIPMSMRRTAERERGQGWPGLCADPVTGFYIGGLGNDCRRYLSKDARCEVHRPKSSLPPSEEPE